MMWVCRPGKHGADFEEVLKYGDVFLGWDGYRVDLSEYSSKEKFKELVISERNPATTTTTSNWAGQLYSFCCGMNIGDYVLIPNRNAKEFMLASIAGHYRYEPTRKYPHVRKIRVIKENIPRNLFSVETQYTLGTFRTIFIVRQEEEVLKVANVTF